MYGNTIRQYLLPLARELYGKDFVFQQDNADICTTRHTEQQFRDGMAYVTEKPSKSPDLNPIEIL